MPKDQPSQPELARPSDIPVPGQLVVASDGRVYEVELVPTGALPSRIAREIGSPQWDDRRRTFFLNEWGIDLSATELRRAARDMKIAARKAAKKAVTFQRVAAFERPEVLGDFRYEGESVVTHNPPVPHVRHNYGDGWGADIGPGRWDDRHDLSAAGMAFARGARFLNASSAGVLARSSRHVIDGPSSAVLAQAIAAGLRDPAIKGATLRDIERALDGPGAAAPAMAGDGLRIWFMLSGCATLADFTVLLEWMLRTLRAIPPFRPLFICSPTEESALRVVEQLSELIDPAGAIDIEPAEGGTDDPAIDDELFAKWRVWKKHRLLIAGRAGVLEGADDLDSETAFGSGEDLDDLEVDSEDALESEDDLDDLVVDPEDAIASGRDIVWLDALPGDGAPEEIGATARRRDLDRGSANFGGGIILDEIDAAADGGYDLAFGPGGTARSKKPPGAGLRMAGRVSASGLATARALHPHERPWWEDMVIAGIDAERAAARTLAPLPLPAANAAIYDAAGIVEGRYPWLLPSRYLVLTKLEDGSAPRTPGYSGMVQHCNDVLRGLAGRFQPVLSIEARGDPATGLNGHRPLVAFGGWNLNRAHLNLRGYDMIELGGSLDAARLWPLVRGKAFADLARVIRAELYDAAAAGLYAEQNGQDPAGSWHSAPGLSASAADAERAVRLIWLAVLAADLAPPGGAGVAPPRLPCAPAPPSISRPAARAALADPVVRVIALELLGWLEHLEGFPAIEDCSFTPQELMHELAARAPKGSLDKLQNGGRLNDKGVRPYLAAPERQTLLRGIGIEAYMPAGHGKKGRRIIFKRLATAG